jgi:hypothetical protein
MPYKIDGRHVADAKIIAIAISALAAESVAMAP